LRPSSGWQNKPNKESFCLLNCSASCSTMKMEAAYYTENSTNFCQTTRSHVIDVSTFFMSLAYILLYTYIHFGLKCNFIYNLLYIKLKIIKLTVRNCYTFRPYSAILRQLSKFSRITKLYFHCN
jgi:hypothetical protein